MLSKLLFVCLLALAACDPAEATLTPIPLPSATPEASDEFYLETQVNDVTLGVEVPSGWEGRKTKEGVLMAEHFSSMETGSVLAGMQAHVFVYLLNNFTIPTEEGANVTWAVLKQVIANPRYIGKATTTEPEGFNWDGHDAAYFLLAEDGRVTLLVALTLETPPRLVVCNISSPNDRSQNIRVLLPLLLGSLRINGITMSIAAVNNLPNPLDFPAYQSMPDETPEVHPG